MTEEAVSSPTYLGGVRVVPNYNLMGVARQGWKRVSVTWQLNLDPKYLGECHLSWPDPHSGFPSG